jgi:hypothetical protein
MGVETKKQTKAKEGGEMIITAIKMKNDMVMVFDVKGEQMPVYQGPYGDVKDRILADAPPGAVFIHWFGSDAVPETVGREEW